jgi:hypothetical protein
MRIENMGFKQAYKQLGIKFTDSRTEKSRREAIISFRRWCMRSENCLCDWYRRLQDMKLTIKTPEELDRIAPLYHAESGWLAALDILFYGEDEQKFHFFRGVSNAG